MIKTLLRGLTVAIVACAIFFAAKELNLFEKGSELLSKIASKPAPSEAVTNTPSEEAKPEQAAKSAVPPKTAETPASKTQKPAPPKTGMITLPPPLTGVRFLAPPQEIAFAFPPHSRSQGRDELTFVHYMDPLKRREVHFFFRTGLGLYKVELIIRPEIPDMLDGLYKQVLADCEKSYADVERRNPTLWYDGRVAASISRQSDKVLLTFTLTK